MEKIAVSKFKATCLAVIKKVNRTGEAICVTKFGKPLAEIAPVKIAPSDSWLGSGIGTAQIVGDIIESTGDLDPNAAVRKWDAMFSVPKVRGKSPAAKPKVRAR